MPDHPRDPRREGNQAPRAERVSVPRFGALVAGQVQAPKRNVPPPPPVHATRSQQKTQTAMPAPPAPGSAPQPPRRALQDLDTLDPVSTPEPRSLSPAPWERPSVVEQVESAVSAHGDRLARAPESVAAPPAPASKSPSSEVVKVPKRWVSAVLRWALPVLLSVGGTLVGYIRGWQAGFEANRARVVRLETLATAQTETNAVLSTQIETVGAALAAEAQSNRSERATMSSKVEQLRTDLEERTPKLQGLPPTK